MEIYEEIHPSQYYTRVVFKCYHEDVESVNYDVTGCCRLFIAYVAPEIEATEIQKVNGRRLRDEPNPTRIFKEIRLDGAR